MKIEGTNHRNHVIGLLKRSFLKGLNKHKNAYLFILPLLTFLITFKYIPLFMGFKESLYDWNGANVNRFIFMDNFIRIFNDKMFYISLLNTSKYTLVTIIINLIFPLLAAELVFNQKRIKAQNFFKVGFVVPMVVPMMVIILMWRWIYAGDYGVINMFLKGIGLGDMTRAWLGDTQTALGAIIFVNFPWIAGLPFLVYLAGLQSIPSDLFEVSRIDGINVFKRFFYIDIPLIASQRKVVVMYCLMNGMQFFDTPYIMTGGGPGSSTYTLSLYLFNQGFTFNRFGYSSAVGVVLFLIIFIFTIINQKFIKESDKLD